MNKKEIFKIKLEKAKESIDAIETSEHVKLFQSTFFTCEKFKKRLNYYHIIISNNKNRI